MWDELQNSKETQVYCSAEYESVLERGADVEAR